jgi:hypothetical protein
MTADGSTSPSYSYDAPLVVPALNPQGNLCAVSLKHAGIASWMPYWVNSPESNPSSMQPSNLYELQLASLSTAIELWTHEYLVGYADTIWENPISDGGGHEWYCPVVQYAIH